MQEKMKICNLETAVTFEDIIRMADYVCAELPRLVITPSLDWVKKGLQEISLYLFHAEQEKAYQAIEALKSRCMDFTSFLVADKASCDFAREGIETQFVAIQRHVNEMLSLLDDRELLASGEYISSILVAAYLKSRKLDVAILDSSEFMRLGVDNKPDLEFVSSQLESLQKLTPATVYVTQEKLCKNAYGEVGYFTQGKSDAYAMYMAIAFHADELILWFQGKGIYTQYVEDVYDRVEHHYSLSFEEAESFIYAGIRLVSPQCLDLARQHKIVIRLTDNKSVYKRSIYIGEEEDTHKVKAVVARKNIDYVRLSSSGAISSYQFLERALGVFGKYKVPIYLMASSSANISLAVELSMDTFYLVRRDLSSFSEVVIENNVACICVLGQFDWDKMSIEGQIIELLRDMPILMISYGSDNSSVSVVVRESDREKALCILSDNFLGTQLCKGAHPRLFQEEYNAFMV